jgi:G3E family GTPase
MHSTPAAKASYLMIGGFLGAGKTTAVARLAHWLSAKGSRVGLITNDQGRQLVDTVMLSAEGFPTEEIAGGCFCCRFNSLVDAATRLTEQTRPEVFIAEPVGSCTDLVATVSYPLRRIYGDHFRIAPLSVLVDPVRAERVHGLSDGGQFSDKVLYIYRKQLEEADVLVINKCDLFDPARLSRLRAALATHYPQARLFEVSARSGQGLEPWFEHLSQVDQVPRALMDVDYEIYADGEARLGWLNATLLIRAPESLDGNQLLETLARQTQQRLSGAGSEIAHLKMTLETDSGLGDLAVVNLVRNDFVPELSQSLQDQFEQGRLTLNMRAEGSPELLQQAVSAAADACLTAFPGLQIQWEHLEFFKPGKPVPTHREQAQV